MAKKLDVLFSEWVEKARKNPVEGHRARLGNGATLMYFPASQKVEVWHDGDMPVLGQHGYGPLIEECSIYERVATNAGLTLSDRRMQAGHNKFCARWTAIIAQARVI